MYYQPFEKALGEKLTALRKEKGKTQEEAANEMGLGSREALKQWEAWERHMKAADLIKVAQYYGVSVDYLLDLTEIQTTSSTIRSICEYTGLSESLVKSLHNHHSTTSFSLNLLSKHSLNDEIENSLGLPELEDSLLGRLTSEFCKLAECFPKMSAVVENEQALSLEELKGLKTSLQISLYEFQRVCLQIPERILASHTSVDLLERLIRAREQEANDGEHQED